MIHSITPYVLFALGLIGSLILFVSLKSEIRSLASKHRRAIAELTKQLSESPSSPAEPVFVPPAARSGLNISKRVQAMRMLRRNEDVSHIAAALGVTPREVELLIRVQRLSAGPISHAAN